MSRPLPVIPGSMVDVGVVPVPAFQHSAQMAGNIPAALFLDFLHELLFQAGPVVQGPEHQPGVLFRLKHLVPFSEKAPQLPEQGVGCAPVPGVLFPI